MAIMLKRMQSRLDAATIVHSGLVGFTAAMLAIAPRLAPWLSVLMAATAILYDVWWGLPVRLSPGAYLGPVPRSAALFAAWATLSSLWAADRTLAIATAAPLLLTVAATIYLAVTFGAQAPALDTVARRRYLRAVPIGAAIGLAYLVEEYATDHRGLALAVQTFPRLMGIGHKGFVYNDRLFTVQEFYLNQNVAALVLLAIPALVAGAAWLAPRWRLTVLWLSCAAILFVVFRSESETAKLACIVGAVTWGAAWRWPDTTPRVVIAMFLAGLVLAPVLGRIPAAIGLDHNRSVSLGVRDRATIWNNTARASLRSPLIGIGIESTRFTVSDPRDAGDTTSPATRPASRLGWHPHNAYLQTWLELGVVGVALLSMLGVAVVKSIGRKAHSARATALALIAAAMATAATGWDMWQAWLVASLLVAIACLAIVEAVQTATDRSSQMAP